MLGSKAMPPLPSDDEAEIFDQLLLCEGDSAGRRIFVAYTMRIPWARRDGKALTKEDLACYSPGARKKP